MNLLLKKLIKKKLKISFAESCTGGMLASSITSISGASKVFNLGFITYSNQAKINVLKINKTLIKKDLYDPATVHFAADDMIKTCEEGPVFEPKFIGSKC